jgi:glyoxylase-like metal-dependent hydrolase (beta-lactamase superfamily II)
MEVHAVETGKVTVRESQREGRGGDRTRPLNTMRGPWTEPLPILAWAIRHPEGTIVVDTGETAAASEAGYFPRWHPYFRRAVRMSVTPGDELGPQLERLGIPPRELRRVVLTHLHTDHAGGLAHVGDAEVLVSRVEHDRATGLRGKLNGYLPHRWPDVLRPRLVDLPERAFGPFPRSMPITDAGDVWIVGTPGHTPGHVSVVVDEGERLLFLAGDVSYTERLMLDGAIDGVSPDAAVARATLERVRRLAAERPVVYLPSHDPAAATRLAARTPAAA